MIAHRIGQESLVYFSIVPREQVVRKLYTLLLLVWGMNKIRKKYQ